MKDCNGEATTIFALPLVVAFVLWGIMFGLRVGNFWLMMSLSASGLALWALAWDHKELRRFFRWRWGWLPLGLVLAAVLYAVFWLGNAVSAAVLPFARAQVVDVYGIRSGADPAMIALALVFLIGPAEEIFWRGFVQRRLERCWLSRWQAVVVGALIYAGVHVWSGNVMLVGAALTGGLFWGSVLAVAGNLWPGIVSHAAWDVAIFLLWPIAG